MLFLYGCEGHLTARNCGFRPGRAVIFGLGGRGFWVELRGGVTLSMCFYMTLLGKYTRALSYIVYHPLLTLIC